MLSIVSLYGNSMKAISRTLAGEAAAGGYRWLVKVVVYGEAPMLTWCKAVRTQGLYPSFLGALSCF